MNIYKLNGKLILFIWFLVGAIALFNAKTVEASTDRDTQITRNVALNEVEDFEGLENEINNIEGVIILKNNGDNNFSNYSLLVPRDSFDESLEKITKYGKVMYDTRSQVDITSEVSRLETSIKSNKEHKRVIMELIEKAKTVDSILEFEQYLMNVEIEQTNNQNQLYGLKDLSNYTTLNLEIEKTKDAEPIYEEGFVSRVGVAFSASFTGTKDFLESIVVGISYILIPLVFVCVIAFVVIRLGKRGKNNEEK